MFFTTYIKTHVCACGYMRIPLCVFCLYNNFFEFSTLNIIIAPLFCGERERHFPNRRISDLPLNPPHFTKKCQH